MSDPIALFDNYKSLGALLKSAIDTFQIEFMESELSLFSTELSKTKQAAKQLPLQEE